MLTRLLTITIIHVRVNLDATRLLFSFPLFRQWKVEPTVYHKDNTTKTYLWEEGGSWKPRSNGTQQYQQVLGGDGAESVLPTAGAWHRRKGNQRRILQQSSEKQWQFLGNNHCGHLADITIFRELSLWWSVTSWRSAVLVVHLVHVHRLLRFWCPLRPLTSPQMSDPSLYIACLVASPCRWRNACKSDGVLTDEEVKELLLHLFEASYCYISLLRVGAYFRFVSWPTSIHGCLNVFVNIYKRALPSLQDLGSKVHQDREQSQGSDGEVSSRKPRRRGADERRLSGVWENEDKPFRLFDKMVINNDGTVSCYKNNTLLLRAWFHCDSESCFVTCWLEGAGALYQQRVWFSEQRRPNSNHRCHRVCQSTYNSWKHTTWLYSDSRIHCEQKHS